MVQGSANVLGSVCTQNFQLFLLALPYTSPRLSVAVAPQILLPGKLYVVFCCFSHPVCRMWLTSGHKSENVGTTPVMLLLSLKHLFPSRACLLLLICHIPQVAGIFFFILSRFYHCSLQEDQFCNVAVSIHIGTASDGWTSLGTCWPHTHSSGTRETCD